MSPEKLPNALGFSGFCAHHPASAEKTYGMIRILLEAIQVVRSSFAFCRPRKVTFSEMVVLLGTDCPGSVSSISFQAHLETASPGQLPEMAAIYREQGMHDLAYDVELAADNRERGDFVELDS
jgi:hypothetical protein